MTWLHTGTARDHLGDAAQNAAAGRAAFFTAKPGVDVFEALANQPAA